MKLKGLIIWTVGMGCTLALTSCATIISGSSQEVSFQSNPEGATVTVSGKVIGKTPLTTTLKKRSGQDLIFSKDGYRDLSMRLDTRLNSWFWGNIVLGGLLGSSTDGISGAVHEYSPSQYMVTLTHIQASPLERKTTLSDRQKTMEFIVVGYKAIMAEVASGGGPYLDSLMELLGIQDDERKAALIRIRALSEAYPSIPEFAEHVIGAFSGRQ